MRKFIFLLFFAFTGFAFADCPNIDGVYSGDDASVKIGAVPHLLLAKDDAGLLRWFERVDTKSRDPNYDFAYEWTLTDKITRFVNHFKCTGDAWEQIEYSGGRYNRYRFENDGDDILFTVEFRTKESHEWEHILKYKYLRNQSADLGLFSEWKPVLLQHTRLGWASGFWDQRTTPIDSCYAFGRRFHVPYTPQSFPLVIRGLGKEPQAFFAGLNKEKSYLCKPFSYAHAYPYEVQEYFTAIIPETPDCVEIQCIGESKAELEYRLKYHYSCQSQVWGKPCN